MSPRYRSCRMQPYGVDRGIGPEPPCADAESSGGETWIYGRHVLVPFDAVERRLEVDVIAALITMRAQKSVR